MLNLGMKLLYLHGRCVQLQQYITLNTIITFDIEPNTFCLDPVSVEKNISPFTKAIMAVDIFGHSANMDRLIEIASKFIEDYFRYSTGTSSYYHDRMSGTIADVGGYSLNYHKHNHTGEGGILVTNDEKIAKKLQLIRNHAEAVVGSMNDVNLVNMIGYNFRLGEIECAIGIEQLNKLKCLVEKRQKIANLLNNRLDGLDGLILPTIEEIVLIHFMCIQ